ncbi:hypothetical protein LCGC14_1520130 [marine sediment metagenome]|uniref:Uncharacterized protein n=1 Tax=marine sediment metagenome TaxID=412755 RepID=A0A0F9LEH4_9ZZZZ
MSKIDMKLRKRMDKLEERTSIFVGFEEVGGHWTVAMEGEFLADELSEIASILRKANKDNVKPWRKSSSKQMQGRLI